MSESDFFWLREGIFNKIMIFYKVSPKVLEDEESESIIIFTILLITEISFVQILN